MYTYTTGESENMCAWVCVMSKIDYEITERNEDKYKKEREREEICLNMQQKEKIEVLINCRVECRRKDKRRNGLYTSLTFT